MIGKTLSHYRIVEKIGAGGMGEVYRAHDERLERDVALKVLPTGTLADEATRKRFRREALALSKLNHPHIATIHDFDTQDGTDFLVMEFVDGETLAAKLKNGALPEKDVARLSLQIVEALEEAHEQNIVHRDLKPGNVMVTPKDQAKILDFGLAKFLRPVSATATTESFTETQGVAGTLPYMAPEQLRGSAPDHRSDIYSFGAVLYEMATGQRPFRERLATALVDDIMHKPPPLPGRLKPDLSPWLEETILKCLEKEPENRYQSAKEVGVDLRRLETRAPSQVPVVSVPRRKRRRGRKRIQSLAVLPLANLSRDPEQEYFAEGMTEALITDLSKVGALKVISRTSAMCYKETTKLLPEIARELKVDAVVEGSVLQIGDRVRITAQLVDARSDEHLWAESYDRPLSDVLGLQSQVAQAITREIEIKLTPQETRRLASTHSVNPEAYQTYLKGRFYWNKRTEDAVRKGIDYFQQAIEKDPGYPLAYVGLADSYNILGFYSVLPPKQAFPLAKTAAKRALEIDDALAEAHASLGYVCLYHDWDWGDAEKRFQRSIELNASYAVAHHFYGNYLTAVGRPDESIAEFRRAQELDPLSLIINAGIGWAFYYERRYDLAIEQLLKALEMDANFALAHRWLGQAYEQKQRVREAIAEFQKASELSGRSPYNVAALAHALALANERQEALQILNELKEVSKQKYVSSYDMAEVYVALAEKDRALEWLRKCLDEQAPRLALIKVEPRLDPLRADPRFQSLLRRLNFPE